MEHSSCILAISSFAWHCFYPLGYVVDGDQDVLTVLGLLEWSHEVNAPHIKYFYLKIVVEGHCIVSCDVPLKLALSTPLDEFLGVLIHRWARRIHSARSWLMCGILHSGLCMEPSDIS
jgi:hypothetical protein